MFCIIKKEQLDTAHLLFDAEKAFNVVKVFRLFGLYSVLFGKSVKLY